MGFSFHGELFEERDRATKALETSGWHWMSDYGSIEIDHHLYGIRVCGIRTAEGARGIESVMRRTFRRWRFGGTHLRGDGREPGWRVLVHRDPERRGKEPWAEA